MIVDEKSCPQLSWSHLANTPIIDDTIKHLMTIKGALSFRSSCQYGVIESPRPIRYCPREAMKQQEEIIAPNRPRRCFTSPVLSNFGSYWPGNDQSEDRTDFPPSVCAEALQSEKHTSEEVTLSTCGEDLHENTHSTDHVEWSDWPVEENWTNKPYPTPIAPPPPFVTLTDLSIITQVVSYFLTVLQMLRRTMGDIKTPQDELEVASNTLTENYYKMRREVDPIAAKYCPNTYWLHPSSLRTPHSASIETWEGVRDVFMPPDMLSRLPSCPRCQRPGVCVASCEPLSRRSFAASMLEREKAVGVDPSDLFDEVREDESF